MSVLHTSRFSLFDFLILYLSLYSFPRFSCLIFFLDTHFLTMFTIRSVLILFDARLFLLALSLQLQLPGPTYFIIDKLVFMRCFVEKR